MAGGGKTDQDNIDAQIRRYKALAEAAAETGRTIDAFHATNIEDFQREVKVQQQVDEIAAKLGTRYSQASEASKKALRDQIELYEQEKSANQQRLDAAQKAADIERKYGDGTAQAAKTRHDLDLAERTNIATKTALTRATKVQQEADEQARLEGKRYDDDLDSLAAGFEHAANAYARANDLYSQGAQVFNAMTSAMGEGLDALTGKSNKTFGQIAGDFALDAGEDGAAGRDIGGVQVGVRCARRRRVDRRRRQATPTSSAGKPHRLFQPTARGRRPGRSRGNRISWARTGPSASCRRPPATSSRCTKNDSSGGVTVNVDMGAAQGAQRSQRGAGVRPRVRAAVVDVIAQEKRPGGTLYSRANA